MWDLQGRGDLTHGSAHLDVEDAKDPPLIHGGVLLLQDGAEIAGERPLGGGEQIHQLGASDSNSGPEIRAHDHLLHSGRLGEHTNGR